MWAGISFPNMLGAITLKYYKACLWKGWGFWLQSLNLSRGQRETVVNKSPGLVEGSGGGPWRSAQPGQFLSVPGQLHRVSRTRSSSRGDPCHVDRASQKEMAGEIGRDWLLFHSDALVKSSFTMTLVLIPWPELQWTFPWLISIFYFSLQIWVYGWKKNVARRCPCKQS